MDPLYSYEAIKTSADYILSKTKHRPRIGIVCGSGLGSLGDQLEASDVIPYSNIPSCPLSTVPGHRGRVVVGTLNGVAVMCLQGRFHMYEGYLASQTTMMIRVMKLANVESVILTNAAGAINKDYRVGDLMIIKDHIFFPGLAGHSPLIGKNDDRFGERFPGMSNAYDLKYRQLARMTASRVMEGSGVNVHEGVYAMVGGPSFETVAELRFLRAAGADTIGMSTAAETIVARQCGMRVMAFSLVTNQCITDWDSEREASHEEVLNTGRQREQLVLTLLAQLVVHMSTD